MLLRATRQSLRSFTRLNSTLSSAASQASRQPNPRNNTIYDKFPPLETIQTDSLPTKQHLQKGWYYVPRTRSGKLPVYSEYKISDGTIHTVITHVQGDVEKLRNDLRMHLGIDDKKRVVIKQASGKIVVKYNVVSEVKNLLKEHF